MDFKAKEILVQSFVVSNFNYCPLLGGGGYLSTVRGTGTCHFLGVLFSSHYGIMGIIFTIL